MTSLGYRTRAALFAIAAALFLAGPAAAETPAAPEEATQGLSLFLFSYRAGPAWQEGRPMEEQGLLPHGRWMRSHFDAGVMFAAGPYTDRPGGLAIFRAASMEEAEALLASDPAVTSGIFIGEATPWEPRFHGPGPLVAP